MVSKMIEGKEQVNENLLNIITPAGIDHDSTHANLGDNVGKIYCVVKYPSNPTYGWLAGICNLEGTATCMEFRYTSPERMQTVLNKRISELKTNEELAKQESERQKLQHGIVDLQQMINRISVQKEPVGYVNIMQLVQGANDQQLNDRLKRVSSAVAIEECNIKNLKFRQLEALQAMAPYGIPNYEKVSNMGERIMPISAFLGGFPMANAGLNDKGGVYLGKSKNKRIVRVNQWARGKDRTNSNWVIFGIPGVGKSTVVKNILTMDYALGTKIIGFDPEREYIHLAKDSLVNGDVIDCTGGTNGRINPLHVRPAPRVTEADLDEDEKLTDFFTYTEENGTSDLALYIQQLRLFFKLYFGENEFTSEIKTALERCLIELYNEFNINWDTDVRKLKNTDFPIMSDLYRLVQNKAENETEEYMKGIYRKLEMLLFSCGEGSDQFLWNGYTTLESKSNFTDLDVSGLIDADDNVKRAQFYNITMWAWQQMSANRTEKVMFVVDEGYLCVDPEYPDLMKFFRNISKRNRKYEGGLMFITHSVVDILDPKVKRFGQALIDNACYKLLMGCDGKNLEETQKLFNLSEREVNILASKSRGQAIFMCGSTRLELKIEVPDEFLEMFGSAGGR